MLETNFQNLCSSEAITSNSFLSLIFLSPINWISFILAFSPLSISSFNLIEFNSSFLTKDGWKSVKPDNGTDYGNLVVGDEINIETEWIVIESINEYDGDFNQPVYNFTVETLNSYIANGIVVHNK